MPSVVKRHSFSVEEKKALVDQYLKSPLGMRAYASAQGIGVSTLTKWAKYFSISLRKSRKMCPLVGPLPAQNKTKSTAAQDLPLFVNLTASLQDKELLFPSPKTSQSTTGKGFSCLSLVISSSKGVTMTVEGLAEDQALRFVRGIL